MIEVINSKDLKTNIDLVCTHCGQEHDTNVNGIFIDKEGIDYIFERDTKTGEEWCICLECKKECDND